jgi:hypothetical protein
VVFESGPKLADRFLVAVELGKDVAEPEVSLGAPRVQAEGGAEKGAGLGVLLLLGEGGGAADQAVRLRGSGGCG